MYPPDSLFLFVLWQWLQMSSFFTCWQFLMSCSLV